MNDISRNTFFLNEINDLSEVDNTMLIEIAEDFYHKQIKEIVDNIIKKNDIKIILIAGPSSSGKTTTSNLISSYLKKYNKKSITISLDDFFLNRDETPILPNGNYDFENITALDIGYLNTFINDLFEKNTAKMPRFDFITGCRKSKYENLKIDDNTIVIIEGIHALNPNLIKKHTDRMYKVYICVDSNFGSETDLLIPAQKVRQMRRLIRDYYNRGRTIQSTLDSWSEVLEGENLYIKPYRNQANSIVDSTHMYEPLMYSTHLLPLLENEDKNEDIQQLINMLSFCNKLESTLLPKNSLLHEFLG